MKIVVRLLIVVVALGLFVYLFVRSARSVRSEAYTVPAAHVASWTLAPGSGQQSSSPILVLRPPQELANGLFSQIFSRTMESMSGSVTSGIPIVLRGELERALAGRHTAASLVEAGRAAGLESSSPMPVCVAMRRISEPGLTRQVYFVIFNAPAIRDFRRELGTSLAEGAPPDAFDPLELSPVMIIGASDDRFDTWLPITANTDADCVAPIEVQ